MRDAGKADRICSLQTSIPTGESVPCTLSDDSGFYNRSGVLSAVVKSLSLYRLPSSHSGTYSTCVDHLVREVLESCGCKQDREHNESEPCPSPLAGVVPRDDRRNPNRREGSYLEHVPYPLNDKQLDSVSHKHKCKERQHPTRRKANPFLFASILFCFSPLLALVRTRTSAALGDLADSLEHCLQSDLPNGRGERSSRVKQTRRRVGVIEHDEVEIEDDLSHRRLFSGAPWSSGRGLKTPKSKTTHTGSTIPMIQTVFSFLGTMNFAVITVRARVLYKTNCAISFAQLLHVNALHERK